VFIALRDQPVFGAELQVWVAEIEKAFNDRLLGVDASIAHLWGRITSDRTRPPIDCLIAATALHHGLTLVTRNTRDFADTGVLLLNPWELN
jgi:predicted nucleic acid-binding protein